MTWELIALENGTFFQFSYEMLSDDFQFLPIHDEHFLEAFQLGQ